MCVAYHSDNLFVKYKNALFKYTIDGKLVKKLYKTSTGEDWRGLCAVSNDGSTIHIADYVNDRLITVNSQGIFLASLEIESLLRPHVMPSGHVLVVCENGVEQISQDGKLTLGTLKQDGEATEIIDVIYHHKKKCLLVATEDKIGKAVIFEMTIE